MVYLPAMANSGLYLLSIALVIGAGYYQLKYGRTQVETLSSRSASREGTPSKPPTETAKSSRDPEDSSATTTTIPSDSPGKPSDEAGEGEVEPDVATSHIYNPPFDPSNPPEPRYSKSGARLITINELAAHGANGPLRPLWLAVVGRVYDVDKGAEHYYGKDGGYNFFSGRDGSRAFVTGEFNEEGLTDDLTGLTPLQLTEIDHWVKFYNKDYTYVGKLIGRYYDKEGKPKKAWYKYKQGLGEADKIKEEQKAQEQRFPPCNSRFTPQDGGTVYCTTMRYTQIALLP